MIDVENIVFPVFTVLAASLLLISLLAFSRTRSKKMLILSGVFTFFLVKGALISISLWVGLFSLYWLLIIGVGIDSLALILLYLSTMRV